MAVEIDQQKAALQQAIAQQGEMGKSRFDAQQKALQDTQQQAAKGAYARASGATAPNAAPPPSGLAGSLGAQSQLIGDTYNADATRAALAYGQENARLGTANADYMDQVNAAVPVIQARAQAEAARQEKEMRAAEEARALELQSQREAAALTREKQAFDREQLQFQKEQFENQRDNASRTGAIGNIDDTAKSLGYNDDLINYMKNDSGTKIAVTDNNGAAVKDEDGNQVYQAINPYNEIMSAAQDALQDPKATWQDIERAISTKENELATAQTQSPDQRHGWQNERRLVEEQIKPIFGKAAEFPANAAEQRSAYDTDKASRGAAVAEAQQGQAAQQQQAAQQSEHTGIIERINEASRGNSRDGWHQPNVENDFDPQLRYVFRALGTPGSSQQPKDIQTILDELGIRDPTAPLSEDEGRLLVQKAVALYHLQPAAPPVQAMNNGPAPSGPGVQGRADLGVPTRVFRTAAGLG